LVWMALCSFFSISQYKTWLSSQAADFFTQAYKNLFPDVTGASVLVVTMFRQSLSMYISFVYTTYSFVNSWPEATFQIALVHVLLQQPVQYIQVPVLFIKFHRWKSFPIICNLLFIAVILFHGI
jgi:hypothetical protein